jgi:hypothetical protein
LKGYAQCPLRVFAAYLFSRSAALCPLLVQ